MRFYPLERERDYLAAEPKYELPAWVKQEVGAPPATAAWHCDLTSSALVVLFPDVEPKEIGERSRSVSESLNAIA